MAKFSLAFVYNVSFILFLLWFTSKLKEKGWREKHESSSLFLAMFQMNSYKHIEIIVLLAGIWYLMWNFFFSLTSSPCLFTLFNNVIDPPFTPSIRQEWQTEKKRKQFDLMPCTVSIHHYHDNFPPTIRKRSNAVSSTTCLVLCVCVWCLNGVVCGRFVCYYCVVDGIPNKGSGEL